jgi:hypothetical protein
MKKIFIVSWLIVLSLVIGLLFWYNDWMYSLPTPVPKNYTAIALNTNVNLPAGIKSTERKPVFLHFFNPACPCSRFNLPHFKSLIKEYGKEVDFRIVVLSKTKYTVKEIQARFDTDAPVFFDENIAVACGVYATPQAVIIDADDKLFYRGNYNSNRYCTNKQTEYARIALDSLLHDHHNISFTKSALTAYGCQLPGCQR